MFVKYAMRKSTRSLLKKMNLRKFIEKRKKEEAQENGDSSATVALTAKPRPVLES